MLGKTILLCTTDKGAARRLAGYLRGAGNEVMIADATAAACGLVAARAVDLVVVDADTMPAPLDVIAAADGAIPVVAVSASGEPARIIELVCDRGVEHYLGRADDGDAGLDELAREVVVTAEKILRRDLFGLDKYLPGFGAEVSVAEVRGATDRDAVVECIGEYVDWLGAGREARRAVAAVVDELVTNAVYDAPVGPDGHPRYAAVDRRHKIELEPHEHVTVRWGGDGDTLAVSVTDAFGALRREHVRAGLRRCLVEADPIEQKAGGAGLGLYTALAYSAQLVINVDRGARTEIIAILDLRRRSSGARRTGRSLHLFFDDSNARAVQPADAVPAKVLVSDSMMVEVRRHLLPTRKRAEVIPLTRPKRRADTVRARGSVPPSGDASLDASGAESIGAGTACGLLRGAHDVDTAIQVALRFLTSHYRAAAAFGIAEQRLATRGADAALAPQATVAAADLTLSIAVAGEPRWILYGAGRRDDAPVAATTLDQVRRELERCLERVDPDEPTIEVRTG